MLCFCCPSRHILTTLVRNKSVPFLATHEKMWWDFITLRTRLPLKQPQWEQMNVFVYTVPMWIMCIVYGIGIQVDSRHHRHRNEKKRKKKEKEIQINFVGVAESNMISSLFVAALQTTKGDVSYIQYSAPLRHIDVNATRLFCSSEHEKKKQLAFALPIFRTRRHFHSPLG